MASHLIALHALHFINTTLEVLQACLTGEAIQVAKSFKLKLKLKLKLKNELTGGWMDGLMDGWMDGQTNSKQKKTQVSVVETINELNPYAEQRQGIYIKTWRDVDVT